MGWRTTHLYEFKAGQRRIGEPAPPSPMTEFFGKDRTQDASRIKLGGLGFKDKDRFTYLYDFGDDWEHQIVVEKTECPQAEAGRVLCLDGARACPPEDCGGVWGYMALLEALEEPGESEPGGQREWLEQVHGRHDPEHFDPAEINARLAGFNPLGKNHSTPRR